MTKTTWNKCRPPLVEGEPVGTSKRKLTFYKPTTELLEYCGDNEAVIAFKLTCKGPYCGDCRFLVDGTHAWECSLFHTQQGSNRKLKHAPNVDDLIRTDSCLYGELLTKETTEDR